MLSKPLPDLNAWIDHFAGTGIPVLRRTARRLSALRENMDTLNAQDVAAVIEEDPLMTLRVLSHMSSHRSSRQRSEIESVAGAILMMGMPNFFRTFSDLPLVEDTLRKYPKAHLGLLRVIARAHRAAEFALDWAVYRRDLDIREIVLAARLHDMAEMLLCCFAPSLAVGLAEELNRAPMLRSKVAQKELLGIELQDLELALLRRWRLPELLVQMIDDAHADHPRVRNVSCAVNLARHSAHGWDDLALPDDYRDIAQLLNTSAQHVEETLRAEYVREDPPAEPAPFTCG